jgi:hypothetical protein
MKKTICILLVASLAAACQSNGAESTEADESATNGTATDQAAASAEPTEEEPAPAEEDVEVRAGEFDKAAFPAPLPTGEVLGGIAFADAAGNNFLAFSREDVVVKPKKQDGQLVEPAIQTTILHIKHVAKKGDAVEDVRSYVERIEKCDADIVLEPQFGEWSVTDIDADGVGEASFAYTAGCTSDISPVSHKVFVTEGGEKYVLRGHTAVKPGGPDGETIGGEYKADKMDEAFMKKATVVWEKTSKGYGFE